MARRTKLEAQATRSAILDAAERLFQQRGVSRTTLQHVAQAAGVTRGAIYWHFADKADLFNALVERVCQPVEQVSALTRPAPGESPLDALRRHLIDLFDRIAADAQVRRVFEIARHKIEPVEELAPVRERLRQARTRHAAQIEASLARAGVPSDGARALAIGLQALVDGLFDAWVADPAAFDLRHTARLVLDAYLDGVRAGLASRA